MKKCKEKMCKKANNKLFYKTNPYGGISLIVLVITIIVVIILAAAVIISLQNNNPMVEANRARYESDVANMQMIFTNTVGKIMAEKQDVVGIKECQINQVTSGVKSTTGEVIYTINNEDAGKIIFTNEKSEEANNYITGKKLPIYSGKTKWNVDGDGILRLSVGNKSYPSNESGGEDSSGSDPVTPGGDGSVSISKEEYENLKNMVEGIKNKQYFMEEECNNMKLELERVQNVVSRNSDCRAGVITSGKIPINGFVDINVVFSSPMKDTNYSVNVNFNGLFPYWSFCHYTIYNKTNEGFSLQLHNRGNGVSGDIVANYIAIPYN